MKKTRDFNTADIKKSDFEIKDGVITAKAGLWDRRMSDVITEDQAQVYLDAEEEYSASVTYVAGKIALKEMSKNENLDSVVFNAPLPGAATVSGKIYRCRTFGSNESGTQSKHWGYTATSIKHGNGEQITHVHDTLGEMARKRFSK